MMSSYRTVFTAYRITLRKSASDRQKPAATRSAEQPCDDPSFDHIGARIDGGASGQDVAGFSA